MVGLLPPSIPHGLMLAVSTYACKHPRLPGWSSRAKARPTTIKFPNVHKIICIQVSKNASALKAQKMTTLFPTMAAQTEIKEKSKLFLGILYPCYIPIEEPLSPGTRHPAVQKECRGRHESVTRERGCGKQRESSKASPSKQVSA